MSRLSKTVAIAAAAMTVALGFGQTVARAIDVSRDLPQRISDEEFWQLMGALAEEQSGGYSSDNLVSNEILLSDVLSTLRVRTKPGGVFVGVGPEQNFSFIADLRPGIAFIVDLRRVNWHLHLMYKAVFELSSDRVDFLSRLFGRRRLAGLPANPTATELMNAVAATEVDDESADQTIRRLVDLLTREHQLPLPLEDQEGIQRVYRAFSRYGVALDSASTLEFAKERVGRSAPTFRDLMTQRDALSGDDLTFLGSEERFRFVKEMQRRNLVVPVIGNFAGPKTLRAIGTFVRERRAVVDLFYLSNVENYLRRDGRWDAFCRNVATMPISQTSLFLRVRTTSFVYFPSQGTAPQIPPSVTELATIAQEIGRCR